jgi:indole-3-glycerol phosphate synthase
MSSAFISTLLSSDLPVIMEIKKRDGHSKELFRGRSLSQIVSAYHRVGAPCLSVVTGRWFGGTTEMLRDVARLTSLPILVKDFITTENQIIQAKSMGASAVLLTAGVLPRSMLVRLIVTALRHGLTPFVEAASETELQAVIHGEDCIIAINNKDIRCQERGPANVNRSFSLLEPALLTGTRCPVSASGIEEPDVAANLITAGFKGVLVGAGLLRAKDMQSWLREFDQHRQAPTQGA